MKNLYQCEKCGATFVEWIDANKCEESHIGIDFYNSDNGLEKYCVYEQGEPIPKQFAIKSNSDADGHCIYAIYKLAKGIPDAEIKALEETRLAKEEENRIYWENWRKEKEAEKAKAVDE